MNPWIVDPWEAARKHYERKLLEHTAAIMKAAGLQQIDVPHDSMMNEKDVVEITDHRDGRFFRIRGTFKVAA